MSKESFEWDPDKDLINVSKHGISFADAQYAFLDPNASLQKTCLTVVAKKDITVLEKLETAS